MNNRRTRARVAEGESGQPAPDQHFMAPSLTSEITRLTGLNPITASPAERAEFFRAIAEFTRDWEILVGTDGRPVWLNPSVERITGYSAQESLDMVDFPMPMIDPADRELIRDAYAGAIRGTVGNELEFRVRRKDQSVVWVASSWQPVRGADEQVLGSRISIRDITARKQAEEELQATKQQLDALLASSPAVIYTCGPAPVYPTTFISDNIESRFGYRPGDFYRDELFWNKQIHPDDLEHVRVQLERIGRGESVSYEYRFKHQSGSYLWLRDEMTPLRDDDGRVCGLIGSWFDITERKWAESMLQKAHDELERRVEERTMQLEEVNKQLMVEREHLQQKNAALKEILNQIEAGKQEIAGQIQNNVNRLALPLIDQLYSRTKPGAEHYLTLLKTSLIDIVSPFVGKLEAQSTRLTPREFEICNMVRNGLSSKEIAAALNTSIETVFKQRKIIRKKLGIANRKRNLVSFLRSLD
ncbi:PAS domain-containing protein [candidate division GN15 bacterium]|nr:PAS domain-containing protein [candidate division GN15 bacterium]